MFYSMRIYFGLYKYNEKNPKKKTIKFSLNKINCDLTKNKKQKKCFIKCLSINYSANPKQRLLMQAEAKISNSYNFNRL